MNRDLIVYTLQEAAEILAEQMSDLRAQLLNGRKTAAEFESAVRAVLEESPGLPESDLISIVEVGGAIRYESPSIKRITGFQAEELIGRHAFDFIHRDDHYSVHQSFLDRLRQPESTHISEFRFARRGGGWVQLEAMAQVIPNFRGTPAIFVLSRDIGPWSSAIGQNQAAREKILQTLRSLTNPPGEIAPEA